MESEHEHKCLEVRAPSAAKSFVWKHFGHPVYEVNGIRKPDTKNTICKLCNISLKYNGNTTNMATHLRRHHSISQPGPVKPVVKETAVTSPSVLSSCNAYKTEKDALASNRHAAIGQLGSTEAFKTKYAFNSVRALSISRQIGIWIASDLRPYSVVESKQFVRILLEPRYESKQFVRILLEPRYELPKRKYFSQSLIPSLYETAKQKPTAELSRADSVSLTTDGWTSMNIDSYVTITAHYMRDDWQLRNCVLQTRQMCESHTGENIAVVLKQAIREWCIQDRPTKRIPVVTDNASNMKVAAKKAELEPHLGCFAHTVNLAAQRGLQVKSVSRLLAAVKQNVNFFHPSTTANALLKQKQAQLNLPIHKLKNDCPTRWNSSYDMLHRFLEQQPAILSVLLVHSVRKSQKDFCRLTDEDITNMEELVQALKVLKQVTVAIIEENFPTLSIVVPMLHK